MTYSFTVSFFHCTGVKLITTNVKTTSVLMGAHVMRESQVILSVNASQDLMVLGVEWTSTSVQVTHVIIMVNAKRDHQATFFVNVFLDLKDQRARGRLITVNPARVEMAASV